jgi:hypothetical protein
VNHRQQGYKTRDRGCIYPLLELFLLYSMENEIIVAMSFKGILKGLMYTCIASVDFYCEKEGI